MTAPNDRSGPHGPPRRLDAAKRLSNKNGTATAADPTLPVDLARWLTDLRTWSAGHGLDVAAYGCACADHDRQRAALMAKKAALVARCEAVEAAR